MSGSKIPPSNGKPGADPSMEEILASIRRILSEDEPTPAEPPKLEPARDTKPEEKQPDDVFVLDPSMLLPESPQASPAAPASPAKQPDMVVTPASLVAPEAAAAAASSVGSLMRTLVAERGTLVRSGGPTIEDIVREEIRPLLKQWLDANLPSLVERLVRTEIERVVGRVVP
ncbi:MAG: DUF2497 domain-containing protein [Acetobacteraceae bacterium]|nr:DUF2497 domain-containing protein [Acetobacteraceae bacterium]